MEERGYHTFSTKGKDDMFHKEPFYNFEMHRKLVESNSIHYDYYNQPFKKADKDDHDPFMYHFTIEDEYIYIIEHAYKHYEYAGVGIRYLIDMYVYLNKYKEKMDFDYIDEQMVLMEMVDFYHKSYKLCMNAFCYEMDKDDLYFLSLLLSYGTYGTQEKQMENRFKGRNKLTYTLYRIYTNSSDYKDQYPLFYKYKFLTPFLPFYRLSKALIDNPKRIIKEIIMLIRK